MITPSNLPDVDPVQASLENAAPFDHPRQIGRYRIERILGEGGFGRIYLAHDDQLDRPVAIKVPRRERLLRPKDAEAYLAEARTVASLDHPNIVPVHDVGTTADGLCFVVSKLIEGCDLAKRIQQAGISHAEAAEWIATAADALHYAHRKGLVHRDIKPGNILLDTCSNVYVADFGLALKEEDFGKGAAFAGTPAYMSPEQARGEGNRVDGRSDIFSLGVVFYELLVGRRPFKADSQQDLLEQISTVEARPPRQLDDTIPKELERICLQAMSKRLAERYTTAKDMADDLRRFLRTASPKEKSTLLRQRPSEAEVATLPPDSRSIPGAGQDNVKIGQDQAASTSRRLGDFTLLSVLGRGGVGLVYRARQISLQRDVALKCLHPGGNQDRFAREIRALGQVKHPNLVEIFTSGSEGEQWFFAMELVAGANLAAVFSQLQHGLSTNAEVNLRTWETSVKSAEETSRQAEKSLSKPDGAAAGNSGDPGDRQQQPPQNAGSASNISKNQDSARPAPRLETSPEYLRRLVELMIQVAEAIQALHDKGVIHRDIKPANIMVSSDGTHAVLMDLGLAKLEEVADKDLTESRMFVGTLRYASPEQVHFAKAIDGHADIYSLGATLWEFLTFRPIHGATADTTPFEVEKRILFEEVAPVRHFNRKVPADLEAIVAKCLEKQPRDRYATAADLAGDLRHFLKGEPVAAGRPSITRRIRNFGRTFKRRRLTVAATVLFAILLAAGFGAYRYWDAHVRVKIEHYANWTMRWGVNTGVHRLDDDQVQHRNKSYKFYVRAGRVEKMEVVNGKNMLTNRHSSGAYVETQGAPKHDCWYDYHYDENSQVTTETGYDRAGSVTWCFKHTTLTTGYHVDRDGNICTGPSGAARVAFVWDDNGFLTEIGLFDIGDASKRQPNVDGSFARKYEVDERGLAVAIWHLDGKGKPMLNKYGFAKQTLLRDSQGNPTELCYFDLQGEPTWHKDGYGRLKRKYDSYGNEVEQSYWDPEGTTPSWNMNGYHRWTRTYDEHGLEVERAYFGPDGKPAVHKDGYQRVTYVPNDYDDVVDGCYYAPDGTIGFHNDGYSRWAVKYDAHGRRTEVSYLDENGKPIFHKDGYARFREEYDEFGNMTRVAYYDQDDKPTQTRLGYASRQKSYDGRGNAKVTAFFDETGKPARPKDQFYVKIVTRFDERGNPVEETYWVENDKPGRHKNGYAKAVMNYDGHGLRISVATFDEHDIPMSDSSNGAHKVLGKRDYRGNLIATINLDEYENPVPRLDYAKSKAAFDNWGNQIEATYWDARGYLIRGGIAKVTAKYDRRGNRTELASFDFRGRPMANNNRVARMTCRYDPRGNIIEKAYWGPDGKPVRHATDGTFKVAQTFDDHCNPIQIEYLDAQGKLAPLKNGKAREVWQYDRWGNAVAQSFFDEKGATRSSWNFVAMKMTYDRFGNRLEESFWNAKGTLGYSRFGIARRRFQFDSQGRTIEAAYLGAAEQPVNAEFGFAKATFVYDTWGNLCELTFWGEKGEPVKSTRSGYAKEITHGNEAGKPLEILRLDENGKLIESLEDGFARASMKYDEQGRQTEVAYWDRNGKPVRNTRKQFTKEAFAYDVRGRRTEYSTWDETGHTAVFKKTLSYDPSGNINKIACYNKQGDLTISPAEGYAKLEADYTPDRLCFEQAYFDANELPTADRNGVARWTADYDNHGNRTKIRYFAADRKPAAPKNGDGYSTIRSKFDDKGLRLEESFGGYDGSQGFVKKVDRYDTSGNVAESAYYDTQDGLQVHKELHYARVLWSYENSRKIDAAYFNERGDPLLGQVVISKVAPKGAAEKAGLQPGDILVSYNGQPVHFSAKFYAGRDTEKITDPAKVLVVLRGQNSVSVQLPAYVAEGFELDDRAAPLKN